ncbi:MAG: AraC family transcriptional regulator [Myxococcota bacterium]
MHPDPLSELLHRSGVRGTVFSRAELGEPWSVSTRGSGEPGPDRPAIFHVVVRGAGFARVHGGDDRVTFRSGDVLIMPHGDAHVLSSDPAIVPSPIASLDAPPGEDGLPCITHGGDGARTSVLCGSFHFTAEAAAMLRPQLPPLLHVRCAEGPAAAWLDATLRLLGAETSGGQPGSETVVARLADVLFVQAVRRFIAEAPADSIGWLSALGDPKLSRVLGLIHAEPATAWTAGSLARRAGMSRTALYNRFTEKVGETPAAYLTRWRMQVAARDLRHGASLAETAAAVGYASEAAFSRAFKRATGESPRAFRAARAA